MYKYLFLKFLMIKSIKENIFSNLYLELSGTIYGANITAFVFSISINIASGQTFSNIHSDKSGSVLLTYTATPPRPVVVHMLTDRPAR